MNDDRVFRPEGDAPTQAAGKKGCGWQTLLILLALVGVLSLTCCVGIGISFYSMRPKFHDDPVVARQVLDEIISIELPESFVPKTAVTMNFFTALKTRGVLIPGSNEKSMLGIASLKGPMAENPDIVKGIEQAIQDQTDGENFTVLESEIREFEIDGQKVSFTFLKGEVKEAGPPAAGATEGSSTISTQPEETASTPEEAGELSASPKLGRQVRAIIPATQGVVLFLLFSEEENWNEEEIVKMIESIKIP